MVIARMVVGGGGLRDIADVIVQSSATIPCSSDMGSGVYSVSADGYGSRLWDILVEDFYRVVMPIWFVAVAVVVVMVRRWLSLR